MTAQQEIELVEDIIAAKFSTEPFHTLYFMNRRRPAGKAFGGTCSDKTLSVHEALRARGIRSQLHTGLLGGAPTHRVLRILIGDRVFFADVGNGWPSLKLYPADRDASFSCFGIRFSSEVRDGQLLVQQERDGKLVRNVEIALGAQDQTDVRDAMDRRFAETYPFSGKLRFAQVVDHEFLFLRGQQLFRYPSGGSRSEPRSYRWDEVPDLLARVFRFDVAGFLASMQLRSLFPDPAEAGDGQ